MRRWWAAVACVLALAGCGGGLPEGVDGDLTDGWRPMPAAAQFRPAAGTCHDDSGSGAAADYAPVPCTGAHTVETVAVVDIPRAGSVSGRAAAASPAYEECSRLVRKFLGADWHTGWLIMVPVLPTADAWSGGARWVRCDIAATSPVDGSLTRRTGTMKAGLRAGGTLRMTCANPVIEGDSVTAVHPVACSRPHTAEFAGVFTATGKTVRSAELERGCGKAIARFAGLPDDGSVSYRVGWLGFPPGRAAAQTGDRTVRCFLWLEGERMTGSYRDVGTGKLPIQYATR